MIVPHSIYLYSNSQSNLNIQNSSFHKKTIKMRFSSSAVVFYLVGAATAVPMPLAHFVGGLTTLDGPKVAGKRAPQPMPWGDFVAASSTSDDANVIY